MEIIGQKVLETVVDQFLKAVVDAKDKALQYKEILTRLQKRVVAMAPLVEQIEKLNYDLGRGDEEVKELVRLLRDGEALVKKCAETVRWWNCFFKRPSYAGKLQQLEEDLNRHLQEIMPLQERRDNMEMHMKINHIHMAFTGKAGYGGGAVPQAPEFIVGLEVHLMELKERLLKRTNVRTIIVSAPGGCGKSTLIRKLCHDEEIKGAIGFLEKIHSHFGDRIYYVTVSQNLQGEGIVRNIIQGTRHSVPEFNSDEDAVNQLEGRLRSIANADNQRQNISPNPILLVLDNVWPGSESFIEKIQFDIQGYKILVTSRSVFPRFKCNYSLTALNSEDSMRLFLHEAELQDGDSGIHNHIVEKVVKSCGGLPLALSVVGRSLCGQPLAVRKKKIHEWSISGSKFESEKDILACLRTSLDVIDDKDPVKQCFLDLASFPEGQRIPVTALIDMWEELYGFDRDHADAMTNIYKLCQRNLADLTLIGTNVDEADNWHGGQFLAQHDLLRELAIYMGTHEAVGLTRRLIVSIVNGNFPDWWKEQKIHPVRARLLSITTDDTFSSNFLDLDAPAAEVLVLNFQSKSYTLPGFIKKLQKVKVLITKNYGFYPTELSNFNLIGSLSALRRILLEHVSIPCIGKFGTQLHNLKRVSLVMCKMDQAFKNRETGLAYVLPNLEEIDIDYCDDLVELPEDVCELSHLRRLNITNCHNLSSLPKEIGKLAKVEVLRLTSCTGLIELPDSIGSLENSTTLDISNCLSIGKLPDQIGSLRNLKKLYMRKCLSLRVLPESMANLTQLEEVICDEERADLWRPLGRKPKIRILKEDINLNWL